MTDKQLVTLEEKTVLQAFSQEGGLDPIVKEITEVVRSFEHDLSTQAGRKRTASLAQSVARSKTYLDGLGKDLVSGKKAECKVIDNARKQMRDYLDTLKVEARAPLAELEAKEQEEIRIQAEALRIKKEQEEVDEAHEFGLLMNDKFDLEREKAIQEAQKIKEEEERKAKEAEAQRIEQAKQQAIVDEQARVKAIQEAEAAEQAKRESNRAHIGKVRKEAKECLINCGLTEEQAKTVVLAINNNEINHIKINY